MTEKIIGQALEMGIKMVVLPISVLGEIKADIEAFVAENKLSDYQKWIIDNRYILDMPSVGFEAKSLVVAIWRRKPYEVVFRHGGREISCIIQNAYLDREVGGNGDIWEIFGGVGLSLKYFHWMPLKRMVVCAGLGTYGRNNIVYNDEWGSFFQIGVYASDLEVGEYEWRDVVNMGLCDGCGECVKNCPTKAIVANRFLVDGEICLSKLTGDGETDIPDWVDKADVNSVYGCFRCQKICPINEKVLENMERILFDEEETGAILNSRSFADFPRGVKEKLWHFDTGAEFSCIPRNLRVMLENIN